jgi:uncharacterized protein YkwD
MTGRREFLTGLALGMVGGVAGTLAVLRGEPPEAPGKAAGGGAGTAEPTPGPDVPDGVAAEVRRLVNGERDSVYGGIVSDLRPNEALAAAAADHSRDMAAAGEVAHDVGDGSILDRYEEHGASRAIRNGTIRSRIADGGENVIRVGAEGRSETEVATEVVGRWTSLQRDREVMLARYWVEHGVGVAYDGGTAYVTQNFV